MANSVSRLKSTDSLAQWADKLNLLMDSVDSFTQTSGSITTTSPATKDLAVYNSGWKNYALTGDLTLNLSGSTLTTKIEDTFISGRTDLGAGVASASDYILIFDASEVAGARIKKTLVSNIQTSTSVAGSNTQLQFNDAGSFGGATGVIYTKGTNTFKAYGPVETGAITVTGTGSISGNLTVKTNVLFVDTTNNRVGVNNTPSYPLDITGNINTSSAYLIGGVQVLSSTTLANTVTSAAGLTTIGTLSSLSVSGGATISGALSANSLTITNNIAVQGSGTSSFTGNMTIAGNVTVDTNTFFIDSVNNRVGILTVSPTTALQVVGTVSATTFSGSGSGLSSIPNSALTNSSMILNGTSVSLGGTATIPSSPSGSTTQVQYNSSGSFAGSANLTFDGTRLSAAALTVDTNTLYVDPTSDRVAIGNTTPSYKLHVTGDIYATGDVYAGSDIRMKENFSLLTNSLEKVKSLQGYSYNKIGINHRSIGLIAQDVEKIIPEVVSRNTEGMKGIDYGQMIALLVESVKELNNRLDYIYGSSI